MKTKKLLCMLVCTFMMLGCLSFTPMSVSATEPLTIYFNDIGGLWPAKNTATYEKDAVVDGRSCVILKPDHDNAQSERVTVSTGAEGSFKKLNIDLKNYKYVEISYKYTSSGTLPTPKINLGIVKTGDYIKESKYQNSLNTMGKDAWCKAVFDIRSAVAPENLTGGGTFCQIQLYPFGYNNINDVSRDSVICFESITFLAEKPQVPDYTVAQPPFTPMSVSATEPLTIYFNDIGGLWPAKNTATYEKGAVVDGRSCVILKPDHDNAQSERVTVSTGAEGSFKKLNIDLKNYKYVEISYKYTSSGTLPTPKINLGIVKTGDYIKESKYQNSLNTMGKDAWCKAVFDIRSAVAPENLTGSGTFCQIQLHPFGYNNINDVSRDSVICFESITFLAEKPQVPDYTVAQPPSEIIPDTHDVTLTIPFSKVSSGIVNNKTTADVMKNVDFEGKNTVLVAPTPETAQSKNISLDSATLVLADMKIDLPSYKYVGITYKYVTSSPIDSKMNMGFLTNGGMLKSSKYVGATEKLVANTWTEALFDLSQVTTDNLTGNTDGVFKQFHLRPFGLVDVSAIPDGSCIYIENMTFYKEKPENMGASKDNPVNGEVEMLETIDLSSYPDYASASIVNYHNGIPNNRMTADLEETTVDGISSLKVTPTPDTAQVDYVIVDGWQYLPARFNLDVYKYAAVLYKYESDTPLADTRMYMTLSANSGNALTSSISKVSNETLVEGGWTIATFNFANLIPTALNPQTGDHTLKQIYIYPFGQTKVSTLDSGHISYLSQVLFFKEKPDFKVVHSYMNGYNDSTFRPTNKMTRAEACTIIARISAGGDDSVPAFTSSAYSDITSAGWYSKYVAYCEAKGFLKSFTGTEFKPNQNITRAEFVDLVYSMGLVSDNGSTVSFDDVSVNHERYTVIISAASSGLVNGYKNADGTSSFKPDNPITRAEVVKVINTALGRKVSIDSISSDIPFIFPDVDKSYWAYAEIAEACLNHIALPDGKWLCSLTDLKTLLANVNYADAEDFATADAYIAQLDATSEERKEQIRTTATTVTVSGTKYYVSNNGNDENDGKTPETAWATIDKVNSANLAAGDGVFFERGGLWRGKRLLAKGGVTYSAYGEGQKPTFYGSPENGAVAENWSLFHEDSDTGKKIWVYNKEFTDVGAIIFNDGEKFSTKAIPNFYKGKYVLRNDITVDFDIKTHLDKDLMIFSELSSDGNTVNTWSQYTVGKLYLRCDAGNPGAVFNSIEFNTRPVAIELGANSDITIDNLCIKYVGSHAIHAYDKTNNPLVETIKNMTVTNCEIGWIGGGIQSFDGENGAVIRFGNGVELYGNCDTYRVENCYVYQCYDAGMTHQRSKGGTEDTYMKNVTYCGNLIENCVYGIEYFLSEGDTGKEIRIGDNILIEDNIIRMTGYGLGTQRPNTSVYAGIKGGATASNRFTNFVIKNNVFDRSALNLVNTGTSVSNDYAPDYDGNTFIQFKDAQIGYYGTSDNMYMSMDVFTEYNIREVFGDKNAKIYFVRPQ